MIRTSSKLPNLVEIKMKVRKTILYTSKMTSKPTSSSFLEALSYIHTPSKKQRLHTCMFMDAV